MCKVGPLHIWNFVETSSVRRKNKTPLQVPQVHQVPRVPSDHCSWVILGHPGCWVLLNFITLPDVSSSRCRHQVRRTSVALMVGPATASISTVSTVSSFARGYTFPGEHMTSPSAPFTAGHSPHQSIKPLGHQIQTSGSNLDHLAPGCNPFTTLTTFSGAVRSSFWWIGGFQQVVFTTGFQRRRSNGEEAGDICRWYPGSLVVRTSPQSEIKRWWSTPRWCLYGTPWRNMMLKKGFSLDSPSVHISMGMNIQHP